MNWMAPLFERAALLILAGRAWSLVERPITLALIVTALSPIEQGYYTTFANVFGLATLVELGFGIVLTQHFIHAFSNSKEQKEERSSWDLLRAAVRLYLLLSIIVVVGVGLAGEYLFSFNPSTTPAHWRSAWWIYTVVSACGLWSVPFVATLDGSGKVVVTQALRLTGSVLGAISTWVMLLIGGGLNASWCLPLAQLLVFGIFFALINRQILREAIQIVSWGAITKWLRKLWPMQWRIAVSWVSGVMLFQLTGPVLLKSQGAEVAGKFGISLLVCTFIQTIAMAPLVVKIPFIGKLIAQHNNAQAVREFNHRFLLGLSIALAVSTIVLILIIFNPLNRSIAQRFLPGSAFVVLLINNLGATAIHMMAIFLRAHRSEPFMIVSLVGAVGTLALLWIVGIPHGVNAFVMGQALLTTTVSLPFAWATYKRSLCEWRDKAHFPINVL